MKHSTKSAVVLAPHQDDEAAGAFGLMSSLQRQGWDVSVLFLTNGDYEGREVAAVRFRESRAVLESMGIPAERQLFLGYADTGMEYPKSFLLRLYHETNPHAVVRSDCGDCTYAPDGFATFRYETTGAEAAYTRHNFKQDLTNALKSLRPDMLILPSAHDCHGDHRAAALFWDEIREDFPAVRQVYYYLLHGGDDYQWPQRNTDVFGRPSVIPAALWQNRTRLALSAAVSAAKLAALESYTSQEPQAYNKYLVSFARREEIYFS